jgi:hypothetical protein
MPIGTASVARMYFQVAMPVNRVLGPAYRRRTLGKEPVVITSFRGVPLVLLPALIACSSGPRSGAAIVRAIMNDPYAPSDRLSPEHNLYRLSGLTPLA